MIMTREGRAALKYQDEPKIPKILISPAHQPPVIIDGKHVKMGTWDQKQFATSGLEKRLENLLGNLDVGNGTPVAFALEDVLRIDLRDYPGTDGVERLLALSGEALVDLAWNLSRVIDADEKMVLLPLGTRAYSIQRGTVRIGDEDLSIDAGSPGLHPSWIIGSDASGPNFDLLLSEIKRGTRRHPCRAMGLPSPRHVGAADLPDQLRFEPLPDAGGAALICDVETCGAGRFRSAMPDQIRAFAQRIASDMRVFWKQRASIAKRIGQVQAVAEAEALEWGLKVHGYAVRTRTDTKDFPVSVDVDFEGLDDALRPGLVPGDIPGGRWEWPIYMSDGPSALLQADLEHLAGLGANGWIDDVARALVSGAPEGHAAVLARLATDLETVVAIPVSTTTLYASVYWRQGVLRAEATLPGKLRIFDSEEIEIPNVQLPEDIIMHSAGRRLSDILQLPFSCDALIAEIKNTEGVLKIRLKPNRWLVDTATGRMWSQAA